MAIIIRKLLFILMPFLAVFIFIINYVDNCPYYIGNDELENKIIEFTKINPRFSLVVAGDSRAERQVIPSVIESRYSIKTINIATAGCDVVTMYNALNKHNLLGKPLTVIVSASFAQVNDGIVESGQISMPALINIPLIDKIILFNNNLSEIRKMYFKAIRKIMFNKSNNSNKSDSWLRCLGFKPVYGELKLPIDYSNDPKTTKHRWYKNINIHGARWIVMQTVLEKMSKSKCKFIIYQPPVSDAFKEHVNGTMIDVYEREYSAMLKIESNKYENMHFIDFYTNPPKMLSNKDYYDPQHLNFAGAEKFTTYLIDVCIGKSLISSNH